MAWLLAAAIALAVWAGARAAGGTLARGRLRVLGGLTEGSALPSDIVAAEPLNAPFADRVLRPALGMVGGITGRLLPARLLAETSARLQRAGMPPTRAADWMGASVLAAVGMGAYVMLLMHRLQVAPLIALLAAVLGWSLPGAYLRSRGRRRAAAVRDDLPSAMDLLTVCVEAGLGFDQALTRVVERFPGPVGDEMGRVLRDQRMGTPRRQAMLAVLDRVELPELAAFIHAVLQSEELGVRVGTTLRVQSESLRDQRRQRAEEQASKAPIKMAFPMIFCILPALFAVVLGPALLLALGAVQGHNL